MITVTEYKNQKVGVFGLGKAGQSTIAALLAGGAQVYAWDDKPVAGKGEKGLTMASYAEWPWKEIRALILSPGVPLTHPRPHAVVELARKHNCPVIGDIELLYRACPSARYVAITGTNGKSTTTTLIGHILKSAGITTEVGGNLGTPALSLKLLGSEGTYVLELSSYQLDLVQTTRFNVAAFLNVTPDHLDRHGSMEGYIAAKKRIFARQQEADTAIIAVDDDYTAALAGELDKGIAQRLVEVSTQNAQADVYVEDGILYDTRDQDAPPYDLRGIVTLTGRHNWQNAAVAYATARACGVSSEAIYRAMQSFAGLRHRLQLVATLRGVRFINDSKATNADATSHALTPYKTIYWIAGGKPKAGGITTLAPYFSRITQAFLIGEAENEFAATLEGKVPYMRCGTLKAAVKAAAERAFAEEKKDAVVLLSPACASFDQFRNFEERGDVFCQLVEAMAAGEQGGARHAL